MDELLPDKNNKKFKTLKSLKIIEKPDIEENRMERSDSIQSSQYEYSSMPNIKKLTAIFNNIQPSLKENDFPYKKLCPKSLYKNDTNCEICKEKFTILKMKKNCKFCGICVCADELIKERADPQNLKDFHSICKICERKYLEQMASDESIKKQIEFEGEKLKLAEKEKVISSEIVRRQSEIDIINREKENFEKKKNEKKKKLEKQKENTEHIILKLKKEKEIIDEKSNELEDLIERIKFKIDESECISNKLKEEEYEIIQRIKALDDDINHQEAFNKTLEKKLALQTVEAKYTSTLIQKMEKIEKEKKNSFVKTNEETLNESRITSIPEESGVLNELKSDPEITERNYHCKGCVIF